MPHKKHLNYSTLVILVSVVFAFIFPSFGELIQPYVGYMLMLVMFVNLIDLDFKKIAHVPKKVFGMAFVNHYIIIPLVSWLIVFLFVKNPSYAAGLILAIIMPVGITVPALVKLLKGRFEESLAFTMVFSVLAIVMIPLLMWILAGIYVKIEPLKLIIPIVLYVLVPLIAAKIIKALLPTSSRITNYSKQITLFLLFFIILGVIGQKSSILVSQFSSVFSLIITVFILNIVLFGITFLTSRTIKELREEISLTMLSYKNYVLAAVLAISLFDANTVLAVVVFAIMQNVALVSFFKFIDIYRAKAGTRKKS
jgi:BASS family bile acid:Na+ symporter